MWVDVKALRSRRRGAVLHNATVVLEMHVAGSLNGASEVFAYQVFDPAAAPCQTPELDAAARTALGLPTGPLPHVFVLLDRIKLRDWACATIDVEAPPVAFAEQSLYRLYEMADRPARPVITNVWLKDAYAAAGCGRVRA